MAASNSRCLSDQYAIADKIVSKEGDYIFSLKGNQGKLHEDVKFYFNSQSTKNLSTCVNNSKGHGRDETRECFVCTDVEWLQKKNPRWKTVNSIIKINSIREFKDSKKNTQEDRYFVSSIKDATPDIILKSVREHWSIENNLHWILDMSFNEDYSRIRKQNAPHVMAIIRHIALNLLQRGKPKRQSIKGLRKICSWDNETITQLVSKNARQLSET